MSPLGLHFYAEDFLAAARATQSPEFLGQFKPARPYLVCHAIECALKAFLSLKGYKLKKLAEGKFGHDLENILKHAKKQDLRDVVTLSDDQLSQISTRFRLLRGKSLRVPGVGGGYEGLSRECRRYNALRGSGCFDRGTPAALP